MADRHTRGARLRQARKRLGLSLNDAAKRLGLPTSTYASKERAQEGTTSSRDFTWEEAQKYAKHLKVDVQWLFTGQGKLSGEQLATPSPRPSKGQPAQRTTPRAPIRIVGYVGASTGEGALYGFSQDQYDEVDRPMIPENAVAVEIRGRSFGPLMDRMLVFYEDVRRPVTDDMIGSICVLGLPDNRILLKKIARGPSGWLLLSNSPDEAPIEAPRIEWAAKMIAITPR